ncbi:MAG TPA: FHA domain-containing protein [Thermoanaerobaculia bacterium]
MLLSDFGIAKRLIHEEGPQTNATLTAPGGVIGTPLYMVPEQLGGRMVDERTDIYALGVMLFEMIAGAPPFGNDARSAISALNMYEPAPRCSEYAEMPVEIDDIIARCLERDPEKRYATAIDLLQDLEGVERITDRELATLLTFRVDKSERERSKRDRTTASSADDREITGAVGARLADAVVTPRVSVRSPAEPSGARLHVLGPPSLGGLEVAIGKRLRIGRSDEAEFSIDSPLVSRLHAQVVQELDGVYIEDLNSANGTWVDDQVIERRFKLHDGASIVIGDVQMVFVWRQSDIPTIPHLAS